ncbi:C-terminal helicase domain-containing protein [Sphingomonas daechungensis]|uniref:C-terminal helicase domain-containing protein n=1 Tax=Sphingomonas daechungensis TaxID=1176646 RepID=UPI001CB96004|nr:C-terminal helicase domain-containing protein [Sphingomonas daechungensis]
MADEAALETAILDEDDGQLIESDVEPATAPKAEETAALQRLIDQAEALAARPLDDPKLRKLVQHLKDLDAKGARPVVFCRFISTAEAVGEALRQQFKKHTIEIVTGRLTPDERRVRVEALADYPHRILVATDCLSEGINLQALFNAVVHYDLNWNPTRHQQREGRVDRFGQPEREVWSVMMFGENSMIDGAVLDVITKKAERIARETGVTVPIPEDSASVTNALMQAMLLRSSAPARKAHSTSAMRRRSSMPNGAMRRQTPRRAARATRRPRCSRKKSCRNGTRCATSSVARSKWSASPVELWPASTCRWATLRVRQAAHGVCIMTSCPSNCRNGSRRAV